MKAALRSQLVRWLYPMVAGSLAPLAALYEKIALNLQPHECAQRFGRLDGKRSSDAPMLWIHGSSVGEIASGVNILRTIAGQNMPTPIEQVLLTTFNLPSARLLTHRVKLLENELPGIEFRSQLLPYDSTGASRAFLEYHKPSAGIFVESDVWPVLVNESKLAGVPLCLVDGRLSFKSFTRWSYVHDFARSTFEGFSHVTSSNVDDIRRLSCLGCKEVNPAPSLKFLAGKSVEHAPALEHCLVESIRRRPAWIAASTHPGEEITVLDAHSRIRKKPGLSESLLILVPRHPNRAENLRAGVKLPGVVLRSQLGRVGIPSSASVLIVDTLGELVSFYKTVRVALVGNTLTQDGQGHNFCEAGGAGIPVVHGPSLGRFSLLKSTLLKDNVDRNALIEVLDTPSLTAAIAFALENPSWASKRGAALRSGIMRQEKAAADSIRATVAKILTR